MSVYIGGYVPGFNFAINSQIATPKILTPSSSGIVSGHIIDTEQINITYTGVTLGTQYYLSVVPQQYVSIGQNPLINFSSNNSGIATVDNLGNVSYVNTGNFSITSTSFYLPNNYNYPSKSIITNLSNSSGVSTSTYSNYIPDPINISNHVLVIYNTNSNASINLKNYYTGKRPQFGSANILGISVPSGQEQITYTGYLNSIQQPIINYLTGVSGTKPIRYGVFMCDIPTRTYNSNGVSNSVSYYLYLSYSQLGLRNGNDYYQQPNHFSLGQYQGNTILTSYINFATYGDCTSYIDKISAGQTGIYLTGNNLNTGYYIEDAGGYVVVPPFLYTRNYQPLTGVYTGYVSYSPQPSGHITTGNNLAGYCSWGTDGGLGKYYANNGTIKWGGANNWYIMFTVDSFGGQTGTYQGCFYNWFASGAWGGTGYENCPVGAVGPTEEPYLGSSPASGFFNLWQQDYPFIECAWQSRNTPYYAVFGDPFITK